MSAYKAMETEYVIHAPAYIMKEGIGVHASFHLRGTINVRDGHAYVTGRAVVPLAAASREIRPGIAPYMSAALSKATGERLLTQRLSDEHGSIIPQDWTGPMTFFLGGVDFQLPLPPEPLVLEISGNVQYAFDEGIYVANPMFPPRKTFAIEVEA